VAKAGGAVLELARVFKWFDMALSINLTGERFGRLLVTGAGERRPSGKITWRCLCDCGANKDITPADLRHGGTKSCGCFKRDAAVARLKGVQNPNAIKRHPLYKRWNSMKQRCTNPKTPFYKNYGGRGVKICASWMNSFEAFVSDMGLPPSPKHTIDRKNNDGDYCPENCHWADQFQQHRNQRTSINITVRGETNTPKMWARKLGINFQRITYAFRKGGIKRATDLVESLAA